MNKLISIISIITAALMLCVLCDCADSFVSFVSCNPDDSARPAVTVSDSTADSDNAAANPVGITMTAHDITPTSVLLRIEQKGGAPTGELSMGSAYTLERIENGEPVAVEPLGGEPIFDLMAQLILPDTVTEVPINLSAIYGELPDGTYRIGKEITDFRAPGDYDIYTIYTDFTIGG